MIRRMLAIAALTAGAILGATSQAPAIRASRMARSAEVAAGHGLYAAAVQMMSKSLSIEPCNERRWERLGRIFIAWHGKDCEHARAIYTSMKTSPSSQTAMQSPGSPAGKSQPP